MNVAAAGLGIMADLVTGRDDGKEMEQFDMAVMLPSGVLLLVAAFLHPSEPVR
jgi:hypothetical protein